MLLVYCIIGGIIFSIVASLLIIGACFSYTGIHVTWKLVSKYMKELYGEDVVKKCVAEIVVFYLILWPIGLYMTIASAVFHKRFEWLENWILGKK